MPADERRPRPRRTTVPFATPLTALRLGAAPLLALVAVLAVVLGSASQEPPPVPVEVLLTSFTDPAPPASVSLTVLDGRLTASWPASSESKVRGYRITASDGQTTRDLGEHTSPYTVTGLTNGTAYAVSVRTVTYDGGVVGINAQGPFTGTRAASSTETPLALPPTGLSATSGDRQLTLTWNAPTDSTVNGYRVFSGGIQVATTNASTRSYTRSGLTNGQTYTATVRATYSSGAVSADSATASGVPRDTVAPAAPTGLQAAPGDRTTTLTWPANSEYDIAGYRVLRNGSEVGSTGSGTRTFTDTGVTNGTTYSYALKALDTSGNTSAASSTTTTTPQDTVRPSPVTDLRSEWTSDGSGETRLFWRPSASSDAVRQRVVNNGSVVAELPASATSYTHTAEVEVRQYYSISVVDDDGLVSQNDPETTEIPRDWMAPAVPSGLAATAGDGRVALSWTANTESDLASYLVLRGGAEIARVTAPTTSFVDAGLTNGTRYEYALQSVDGRGNASAASSPTVTATPEDTTAPAVPTGLAAVRGDGQVSLTWTRNTEADLSGYDLFRRPASSPPGSAARVSGAVLGAAATSYTDSGLTNDVEYTYTLRARDRSGNSSASSPGASATPTDLTPPAVPSRPSAVAGDTAVTLSWTANSETDLASYQVVRNGQVIATVTKPTTTYTDRSVTNGTAYDYQLTAVDTHGNASGATTPVVRATPRDLTPPAVPTGLTATRGDGRVVLSWSANTEGDLASYRVLRGSTVVATVTAPTTTYTDTGLVNDTEYSYHLAAYDTAGNGSATTPTAVKATPTDLTAPAAPAGVASSPGDRIVDVTWSANTEPDLAAYRVYRDGQRVATTTVVAPPGTTPTSYRDSGLTNGAAHTYAVTAVDTHGNESLTSTTSATPADTTPPGPASGLAAAPSDRQVSLSWTASPAGDVASYRVLRDGVEIGTLGASATSYTDTSLTNGRAYAYSVVVVDTAGNRSTATATVTTTPRDAVAPGAPTGVSATPGSGSATVRWTAPGDSDLATYRVLRADGSTAATVAAPATSAVVSGLTNGTPVTFTVVVVDTSGNTSARSAAVTTTPAAAVATFSAQGAGTSGALAVSPDGRWVVLSTAARLEPGDTNSVEELYRVDTTRASAAVRVAPLGEGYASTPSQTPEVAVSADGRYVVLATTDRLVSADGNGRLDVYRVDLSTTPPTYALVSVPGAASGSTAGSVHGTTPGTLLHNPDGVQAKGAGLAVSGDGTRVLFYSARTDLVPASAGRASGVGVYAKDLTGSPVSEGPVTLVSSDTGGASSSRTPTGPALALTPDGRYAFFTATSSASGSAVLRKDLGATTAGAASRTGQLLVVSSTAPVGGVQDEVGALRDTGQLSVSADGRYAAFLSTARLTSSTPTATQTAASAYLKDLVTGATTALGSPGSGVAEQQVSLSPDGSSATFTTAAALTSSDANGAPDAYRRDLASGTLVLVTADAAGGATAPTTNTDDRGRVVDLGGSLVVVLTVQALDPADTNRVRDAYLKDLATGTVTSLVRP